MNGFDELFGGERDTHRPTVPPDHVGVDELGPFLRALRMGAGLSQREVGESIGRSRSYVSRAERSGNIHLTELFRFGYAVDCPLRLRLIDNATGEATII